MAELWATEELPGHAWNDDEPDPAPDDADLWGQAITYWQTKTMTTIHLTGEYL